MSNHGQKSFFSLSREGRQRRGEWFTLSWKHRILFVALAAIFGLILGSVLMIGLDDDANGAVAAPKDAQATTCSSYGKTEACGKVTKKVRKVHRRIKNGNQKLTPKSFDGRKAFKEPKKVKRFYVKRIMAGLAATADQRGGSRCCSRAYAKALYVRAMDGTRCAFVGNEKQLVDIGALVYCRMINMPEREKSKIDTDTVRRRGTIALCIAGSAAAVTAAIPSGGLSLVAAGAGAGTCGLATWGAIEEELESS